MDRMMPAATSAQILGKRPRSSSPPPRSEKMMEAAGALYGGYIARGGYRARSTRLDFESFVDALPKEFWSGAAVAQEKIEEAVLAVQGDKKRIRVDAKYPTNAKTILALEFLGSLAKETTDTRSYGYLSFHNILEVIRAELVHRAKQMSYVLRYRLDKVKVDLKDAQALLVRLEGYGSSKDQERTAELVKSFGMRKDMIDQDWDPVFYNPNLAPASNLLKSKYWLKRLEL